jgi:dihydrofolate reductase
MMCKLIVFNNLSVDGRFVDRNGSMSWAKNSNDEEFDAFASDNARGGGTLLFGRVTYELMAGFWPTRQAIDSLPIVAERMNKGPKIVFSRTLEKASWNNTRLVTGDLVAEIRKLKKEPGDGMVILGSGSLVSQLAREGLIDEFQIVLIPAALGAGRTMFDGLKERLSLKLTRSRVFRNGNVFLCYETGA